MAIPSLYESVSAEGQNINESFADELLSAEKIGLGIWGAMKWRARIILWRYMGQLAQSGLYQTPDEFGEI